MNTFITMPRMTFSTRNAWLAKMSTLINGDSVLRSTEKKISRSTAGRPSSVK